MTSFYETGRVPHSELLIILWLIVFYLSLLSFKIAEDFQALPMDPIKT